MNNKIAKSCLRAIFQFTSIWLWTVFILILALYLGKWNLVSPVYAQPINADFTIVRVDNQLNQEIDKAKEAALAKAEEVAIARLDAWISERMASVDPPFLDWYFGYWTKEKREILKTLYDVLNIINSKSFPPGYQKIVDDVKNKFEQVVLPPIHLQMELNYIAREVARSYEQELNDNLLSLKEKYLVAEQTWPNIQPRIDNVLKETTERLKGRTINTKVNELKNVASVFLVGEGLGMLTKNYNIVKPVTVGELGVISDYRLKLIKRISSTVSDSQAKQFLSSIISTIEANPQIIIAVGIITVVLLVTAALVLDYYDYKEKVAVLRPQLKNDILECLKLLKELFIYDEQIGIISVLQSLEVSQR